MPDIRRRPREGGMNGRKAKLACAVFAVLWTWGQASARGVDDVVVEADDAEEEDRDALVARIVALDAWRWIVRDEAPRRASATPSLIVAGSDDDGAGNAEAWGVASFASGLGAWAIGDRSTTVGTLSAADGKFGVALGYRAWARYDPANPAEQTHQVAVGSHALAFGQRAVAIGGHATAHAGWNPDTNAEGTSLVAIGTDAYAFGRYNTAVGDSAQAMDATGSASAFGAHAMANVQAATALGARSQALADNSVAIGAGSIANLANTVSIGTAGAERRLVHVADGIADTDAASYGQVRRLAEQVQGIGDGGSVAIRYDDDTRRSVTLDAGTALRGLAAGGIANASTDAINGAQMFTLYDRLAGVLGGNAGMAVDFIRPAYVLDNGTFDDVGSALGALQAQSRALLARVDGLAGGTTTDDYIDIDGIRDGSDKATNGGVARSIAIGAGARVSADATDSVAIGAGSVASRSGTVSVGDSGHERQVAHVATGTAPTDAVNVAQMQEADEHVYANARRYVDLRVENALAAPMAAIGELRTEMDDRLVVQDRRIDRHGAMTSAAMNMAASAAGVRTPHRVAVGAGVSGGEQALAFGYQHAISDRAALTLGGAFSSGENSAGVGFSFGW